jgi:hypothetical protein
LLDDTRTGSVRIAAIHTGSFGYSHRGDMLFAQGGKGVIFQIGNIKASRHHSFNDVNVSTFPNKFSEKVLTSTPLSTICQVNLAETCMHVGGNISECGNSTAELQK